MLTAFRDTKGRILFINMYGFLSEATIVSYCPKKSKVITFLITIHKEKAIESPGENKPETIQHYDSTKGLDTWNRCSDTIVPNE